MISYAGGTAGFFAILRTPIDNPKRLGNPDRQWSDAGWKTPCTPCATVAAVLAA